MNDATHPQVNALELLRSDHRVIIRLFRRIRAVKASRHPAIFASISDSLTIHMHIEESVMYPAIIAKGNETLAGLVRHGIEEHHQVKMFLEEMAELIDDVESFEPKLSVLIEDTEAHIAEEEAEIFPLVEVQFDANELFELGRAMKEERDFKKIQAAAFSENDDRGNRSGGTVPNGCSTDAKPPFHIDRF